jgi:hypothetical protein
MICFLFQFPEFGLHSGPETPTYTSFSLRLLLDQPPYWHQSRFLCFCPRNDKDIEIPETKMQAVLATERPSVSRTRLVDTRDVTSPSAPKNNGGYVS